MNICTKSIIRMAKFKYLRRRKATGSNPTMVFVYVRLAAFVCGTATVVGSGKKSMKAIVVIVDSRRYGNSSQCWLNGGNVGRHTGILCCVVTYRRSLNDRPVERRRRRRPHEKTISDSSAIRFPSCFSPNIEPRIAAWVRGSPSMLFINFNFIVHQKKNLSLLILLYAFSFPLATIGTHMVAHRPRTQLEKSQQRRKINDK